MPGLNGLGIHGRREGDCQDDDEEPYEVGGSAQSQRLDLRAIQADGGGGLLRVVVGVQGEVGGQQHRVDEQPLREKMESPGEGHSAEESEEERRIAQGREQTAAVGHDENGEQHRVDPIPTLGVGVEQRADQKHGRASRTHEARENGSDGQEDSVIARGGLNIAFEEDTARNDEERQKQSDELPVLDDGGEYDFPSPGNPHPYGHGQPQDQSNSELTGAPLPPVRCGRHEWKHRNAGKHGGEGQDGPPLQLHDELLGSGRRRTAVPAHFTTTRAPLARTVREKC